MTPNRPFVPWPATKNQCPLNIVQVLVGELEARAARFCQWKSNEHLAAAVAGDTDIDMLFDFPAREQVVSALAAAGFWPCRAVWRRRYFGIEDHLGIDAASGKLVHVHAHFRLMIGEEAVKSFHLPWEDEILDSRHWEPGAGFYAAEPARELLLLMVRSAIKQRYPSLRKRLLSRRTSRSAEDAGREFAWLKDRVSLEELKEVADRLLGARVLPSIEVLYARGLGPAEVRLLFEACDDFKQYRRRGHVVTLFARWGRWLADLLAIIGRRLRLCDRLSRRRLIEGGIVVAVLGSDGSGKSTLVEALDRELSKKTDVLRLYFGSGAGASSVWRWPLVLIKRIRRRLRQSQGAPATAPDSSRGEGAKGRLRTFSSLLWALALAVERRQKLHKAQRARRAGILVIADRYPQDQIAGYNDGPLLGFLENRESAWLRKIAAWEHSQYRKSRTICPDLVLKLVGTPGVLGMRREDMSRQEIERKQEGIRSLRFDERVRVVEIDADQSSDRVLALAMAEIGRQLAGRSPEWKLRDDQARSGAGWKVQS